MSLRSILTKLHPDFNGGNSSRVDEFTKLMKDRKNARLCKCGCGRKVFRPHAVHRLQMFFDAVCARRYRYYRNSLTAAAALLMLVVTGCETGQPRKMPRTPPPVALMPPLPPATIARREAAAVVLPPPPRRTITLGWLHENVDVENERYNLYSSTNLAQPRATWQICQVIDGQMRTTVVTNDAPQRFFFLTASNTLTGQESVK